MRKRLIISGENMIKSASARALSDSERLALAMLLRDAANNPELQDAARRNAADDNAESMARSLIGRLGEYKTVPVTTTNVEGIGAATVTYGTMSFQVTSSSAKAEKRAVFGDYMSGFAVINE
jgi:hypothetical protein